MWKMLFISKIDDRILIVYMPVQNKTKKDFQYFIFCPSKTPLIHVLQSFINDARVRCDCGEYGLGRLDTKQGRMLNLLVLIPSAGRSCTASGCRSVCRCMKLMSSKQTQSRNKQSTPSHLLRNFRKDGRIGLLINFKDEDRSVVLRISLLKVLAPLCSTGNANGKTGWPSLTRPPDVSDYLKRL